MLHAVRLLHTVVWAFFASCVVAIPLVAWRGDARTALLLVGVVAVEVAVLLANRWRCPLTDVAARYTDARADNFDIYLPRWLARHNKTIFGALYIVGIAASLARCARG